MTYLRDRNSSIAYMPVVAIVAALIFQVLFSQLPIMNPLFGTEALTLMQGLICIGAGVPVVVPALLLKRFAPFS